MKKRGPSKVRISYSQADLFNFYKETSGFDIDITKKKFNTIIKRFNREIIKMIIYKNFEFKMPYTLGILRVRKSKPEGVIYNEDGSIKKITLPVDYKKTLELWERNPEAKEKKKLVRHLNEHTNGYVYKFYWDKRYNRLVNKESYRFKPSRTNARWLASVAKDESIKTDYYE